MVFEVIYWRPTEDVYIIIKYKQCCTTASNKLWLSLRTLKSLVSRRRGVIMACGGTEIEVSKINLECVLCEKEKKRTAPLPATAVFYDTHADILPHTFRPCGP